jgi:hypothetical protein
MSLMFLFPNWPFPPPLLVPCRCPWEWDDASDHDAYNADFDGHRALLSGGLCPRLRMDDKSTRNEALCCMERHVRSRSTSVEVGDSKLITIWYQLNHLPRIDVAELPRGFPRPTNSSVWTLRRKTHRR